MNHEQGEDLMKLKPLNDRVVVKRLEEKEVRKGSIIIPDTAKEKPQEGEVLAVGPGKLTEDGKRQAMSVTPGDKILFGKWSGNEVKLGDDEVLIMREEDILAILG
jgi:chaperonin GroES